MTLTEAELAELEKTTSEPWYADGTFIFAGAHEADSGCIAQAWSEEMVKAILAIPRLVEEVRRLRGSEKILRKCRNPSCDSAYQVINYGGTHRCRRDGRWLVDGSEM